MAILALNNLSLAYLERPVLTNCSLSLEPGCKCGLVGINGAGKTSLFRLLTGDIAPTGGDIITPKGLKIGIMEQELKHHHHTLYDELMTVFQPLKELEREIESVNYQLQSSHSDALIARQFSLNEAYIARGGLTYQSRVSSTLLGLGFSPADFSRTLGELSGGQRSKLALAKLLLSEADLLLLDEPTNHLDITALEWLEDFLKSLNTAYIVISHDRFFLDRVTEQTIHLQNHRMKLYKGNFTAFKQQYAAAEETALNHNANIQREIHRVENIIKQQKQWNREKNLVTAHSKEKVVERLKTQLTEVESRPQELAFHFPAAPASGNDLVRLADLGKSFGSNTLFAGLNFLLHKGEKVCLLGANGAGKTTIFRLIMQELQPDSGTVTLGAGLKIGYFDQVQKLDATNESLLENLRNTYPKKTETELRGALAAFLFPAADVEKSCSVLSGGEKARLGLLKILLSEPNLLLLDEPTNHLDIAGREALEAALKSYDGAILAISHDRYFINALAEKIVVLQGHRLTQFLGNYSYYLEKRDELLPTEAQATAAPKAASGSKLSYQAQKEQAANLRRLQNRLKKLEDEIVRLEDEIAGIDQALADPAIADDYQQLTQLSTRRSEREATLAQTMDDWEACALELED